MARPRITATPRSRSWPLCASSSIFRLFHLPGRACGGFLRSLFALMGVDLPVPDHSTLSRRLPHLEVELGVRVTGEKVHIVIDSRGMKVSRPGNEARNHNVRAIAEKGRDVWKRDSGYTRRSLSETNFFRLKTIFGDRLHTRELQNQFVEMFLNIRLLNNKCRDCGRCSREELSPSRYSEERKAEILRAYEERSSLAAWNAPLASRGRRSAVGWKKDAELWEGRSPQHVLEGTLLPYEAGDVLELDEVWTFVGSKANRIWMWIALCRRTRQVVAWMWGDHSTMPCHQMWNKVSAEYRGCFCFAGDWDA